MVALALIFMVFPYTKVFDLDTYTQPYALILCILILLFNPKILFMIPKYDYLFFIYMSVVGILFFIFLIPDGVNARELQYLLVYVTPILSIPVAFLAFELKPEMTKKIISIGIVVWFGVSLAQTLISPDFLIFLVSKYDNLGLNIQESGRGVLSLAPEPTHHGLHMVVMAAILASIKGNRWIILLALIDAVVFAASASAIAALSLAVLIWGLLNIKRWPLLAAVFGGFAVVTQILILAVGQNSRAGNLISNFLAGGLDFLLLDGSSNARFYGIVGPIEASVQNFFFPFGMSHQGWLEAAKNILAENPQIYFLSTGGPASGFGLLVFQIGFFALPLMFYFFKTLCVWSKFDLVNILHTSVFFVFMLQIYLSSPAFSLAIGAIIWARTNEASRRSDDHLFPAASRIRKQSV